MSRIDDRLRQLGVMADEVEEKLQKLDKSATMPHMDVLDAKISAAEARTDTKFAQLLGKMDLFSHELSGVRDQLTDLDRKVEQVDLHARSAKSVIITTILASLLGIAGLTYAGIQIFQGGMSLSAGAFSSGMAAAEKASAQPPAQQPATK